VYTDSLVAFLDILGFTDSIRETENDPSKARTIADMLSIVHRVAEITNKRAKESWKIEFVCHAFSDSIIISCPTVSTKALICMAHVIAMFQFDIMQGHFFLRGCVSAGGHYDKAGVAFGPAFLRAYEMEELSTWPRVLIDPLVLKKLPSHAVKTALQSYISRDENGLYYFNYLHLLAVQHALSLEGQHFTREEFSRISFSEPLEKHKQLLTAAARKLIEDSRLDLLPKYHALAHYHNRYVREVYQDLPTQKNYKDVDPNTITGQIINSINILASSREGIKRKDIDSMLTLYTEVLYRDRIDTKKCEIDLGSVFGPLYPHLKH
jgi:hypothetical protein